MKNEPAESCALCGKIFGPPLRYDEFRSSDGEVVRVPVDSDIYGLIELGGHELYVCSECYESGTCQTKLPESAWFNLHCEMARVYRDAGIKGKAIIAFKKALEIKRDWIVEMELGHLL